MWLSASLWHQSHDDRWTDEEQEQVFATDSPILCYSLLKEIPPFPFWSMSHHIRLTFFRDPIPFLSIPISSSAIVRSIPTPSQNITEERGRISYPSLFATHISLIWWLAMGGEVLAVLYRPYKPWSSRNEVLKGNSMWPYILPSLSVCRTLFRA